MDLYNDILSGAVAEMAAHSGQTEEEMLQQMIVDNPYLSSEAAREALQQEVEQAREARQQ